MAGQFVDLLGDLEPLTQTPLTEIEAPYGPVRLASPEELLAVRILVSAYPPSDPCAAACARKLMLWP